MGRAALLKSLLVVLLVAAFVGGTVALLVAVGRDRGPDRPTGPPERVPCGDCPYLYHNNPAHPDYGPQGLRDRVFAIPKPAGVFRILVLGDSIVLGDRVPREETFVKRLERALRTPGRPVEVINAGVAGYSPFNELHYYLAEGRRFAPDLVLVGACMNDVADPSLHWFYTREALSWIPDEAIPNPEDHARRVLPILERRRRAGWRVTRAEYERMMIDGRVRFRTVNGRTWPVYLTGEDTLTVDALLDYESPEWRWLRGMYDRMAEAARHDGAGFVLAVFPLEYQLDPAYPYFPQESYARYCRERGLDCLDLLPIFRAHRGRTLFMEETQGMKDVWHLSPAGHAVTADALAEFLRRRRLVPTEG